MKGDRRKLPCLVQTEKEWLSELKQRYTTFQEVAFRCPSCNHVQNIGDLVQQGKDAQQVYQYCYRCQKHIHQMSSMGRCVIDKNGQQHPIFDFG